MRITRRIFVSGPRDVRLDRTRNKIKKTIVAKIKGQGYEPQLFLDGYRGSGLAAGKGWSLEAVDYVMKRCIGAVLIGVPFWKTCGVKKERWLPIRKICGLKDEGWLPTDYCQYEGAVARAYGLPTLAIATGISQRILFHDHEPNVVSIPFDNDLRFKTSEFKSAFNEWNAQLKKRYDVFLGYCSRSQKTAQLLRQYLKEEFEAKVLDWKYGLTPGSMILKEIEKAASKSSVGIFLFTGDDRQKKDEDDRQKDENDANAIKVPRDNVVFEAGFFSHAKGNDRVLIIQEQGAKLPTDLGGKIYPLLSDRTDIGPIKDEVRRFMNTI